MKIVFFRNTHESNGKTREVLINADGTVTPKFNELMDNFMWAAGGGTVCHILHHKHYRQSGMTLEEIIDSDEKYHEQFGQEGKLSISDILRGLSWLIENDLAYYELDKISEVR